MFLKLFNNDCDDGRESYSWPRITNIKTDIKSVTAIDRNNGIVALVKFDFERINKNDMPFATVLIIKSKNSSNYDQVVSDISRNYYGIDMDVKVIDIFELYDKIITPLAVVKTNVNLSDMIFHVDNNMVEIRTPLKINYKYGYKSFILNTSISTTKLSIDNFRLKLKKLLDDSNKLRIFIMNNDFIKFAEFIEFSSLYYNFSFPSHYSSTHIEQFKKLFVHFDKESIQCMLNNPENNKEYLMICNQLKTISGILKKNRSNKLSFVIKGFKFDIDQIKTTVNFIGSTTHYSSNPDLLIIPLVILQSYGGLELLKNTIQKNILLLS